MILTFYPDKNPIAFGFPMSMISNHYNIVRTLTWKNQNSCCKIIPRTFYKCAVEQLLYPKKNQLLIQKLIYFL